ncbi:MAG: LacI family DNA-binding transcriptional regulator [Xanthomonadales bacterium]|nr:LacI family DNA-binding transcriptional regulator [Xanthomonadales bacterium]
MPSRIDDVARRAGVSLKTVSRVLNREPNVRETTRARVEAAVRELDYRPHPSARSLAGRRSYVIALLYDNPSANYLMQIQAGVLEACEANHYTLMLRPLGYRDPDLLAAVRGFALQYRPDGMILTPPITDHVGLLHLLDSLDMPYASISSGHEDGHVGVELDETRAAREIVGHLIALGHRRIAHISGHADHCASGWRLSGYRQALQAAGLDGGEELIVPGEFSFESGVAAGARLFDLPDPPSAIFAGNDDMAAGALHAAYERGLTVPGDVSVCGFDDTPIALQVYPSLTTIRQPSREMGRTAAIQLIDNLAGHGAGARVRVEHQLMLRSSTGPAPAR